MVIYCKAVYSIVSQPCAIEPRACRERSSLDSLGDRNMEGEAPCRRYTQTLMKVTISQEWAEVKEIPRSVTTSSGR
jgi:hypothetical protein